MVTADSVCLSLYVQGMWVEFIPLYPVFCTSKRFIKTIYGYGSIGLYLLLNSTLNVRHISIHFTHRGLDLNSTRGKQRQNVTTYLKIIISLSYSCPTTGFVNKTADWCSRMNGEENILLLRMAEAIAGVSERMRKGCVRKSMSWLWFWSTLLDPFKSNP